MHDKIQTGLRLPEDRYNQLTQIAEKAGVSINQLILLLIEVGLKAVNLGIEGLSREELRSYLHTDGQ